MNCVVNLKICLPMVEGESDRLQCEEERRPLSINTWGYCNGVKGTRHWSQLSNIYIAAGEIYGGQRRMAALTSAYPNVVSSSTSSTQHCIIIIFFLLKFICYWWWSGKKRNFTAFGSEVFPEPFFPDGSIGLYGVLGEWCFHPHLWW